MKVFLSFAAASVAAGVMVAPAAAADISGAGATFPYPIYAKWAEAYNKATGVAVNYQPVGSGEGIRQIQRRQADFRALELMAARAGSTRASRAGSTERKTWMPAAISVHPRLRRATE